MVLKIRGIWEEKKKKYKERDRQENDNELNILAKLKKENQLTKMLHSDVKFVSNVSFLGLRSRKSFTLHLK